LQRGEGGEIGTKRRVGEEKKTILIEALYQISD
jgi:hypothetical protein